MNINNYSLYQKLIDIGSIEHYEDPVLYDYEYRKRRKDVAYYLNMAKQYSQNTSGLKNILELGCGTGRLLLPLLRQNYTVFGVDRSKPMLEECQKKLKKVAIHKQKNCFLIQADFRNLPFKTSKPVKFQMIICPFNSFMHLYSRSDVESFLRQIRTYLEPTGIFIFDLLVPDLSWLNRNPTKKFSKTRFIHPTTKEFFIYSTNHFYDPITQIAMINIYYDKNNENLNHKTIHLSHRQYFPAELESILAYNGFKIIKRDGDFYGGPLTPESEQQIIHAMLC